MQFYCQEDKLARKLFLFGILVAELLNLFWFAYVLWFTVADHEGNTNILVTSWSWGHRTTGTT